MSDCFTGAIRSSDADLYDFGSIPPLAMLLLARVAKEGGMRYGRFNYMRGFPISDLLNHAERHINLYKCGDRSEMHLVKAAWGCLVAAQQELLDPDLSRAHMLGPGCTITPEMDEMIDLEQAGDDDDRSEALPLDLPDVQNILEERFYEQHDVELEYKVTSDDDEPTAEESDEVAEEKPIIHCKDFSDPELGAPIRVTPLKLPECCEPHEVCRAFLKDGFRVYYAKPPRETGYDPTKPSSSGSWWEDKGSSSGEPLTEPY